MPDAYAHVLENAAVFDQSDRGKVLVSGADARTFLHNLSTNDIKNLKPGMGCEAFFATAQAKAVAYVRIFCDELNGAETFFIDLDPGLSQKVTAHLDRFIISEHVEFADITAEYEQWHVAGPNAETVVNNSGLSALNQTRRCDRLGVPGWDILCKTDACEQTSALLAESGATQAGPDVFNILRIEAGMPVYGVDIDENRFVVEVGRTKQAISYTKGCYLGQEPIVMARDRGHVNRTLLGLRVRAAEPPLPGTKLTRDGKEVGDVTSSVASPRFGTIALAYIRRGNQDPGTVLEWTIDGRTGAAEVASLPFTS
jgi:folate-binding protein YgfZ